MLNIFVKFCSIFFQLAQYFCDQIFQYLSGWTPCTVNPSWTALIQINTRNTAVATCYLSRIYKLWEKNFKFLNLIQSFQIDFNKVIITDCYPCLVQAKSSVSSCLDKVSKTFFFNHQITNLIFFIYIGSASVPTNNFFKHTILVPIVSRLNIRQQPWKFIMRWKSVWFLLMMLVCNHLRVLEIL